MSVNFIENAINEISQEEICEKGLSIEQKNALRRVFRPIFVTRSGVQLPSAGGVCTGGDYLEELVARTHLAWHLEAHTHTFLHALHRLGVSANLRQVQVHGTSGAALNEQAVAHRQFGGLYLELTHP